MKNDLERDEPLLPDWKNLPETCTKVSLWDSLHDAQIVSIRSDLLLRTMTLTIESDHLRDFHKFPEGFRFIFELQGVQSARVLSHTIWPGEFTVPKGVSRDEESRLIDEYQGKWREESVSWSSFEASVTRADQQILDVQDATLAFTGEEIRALQIDSLLDNDAFHQIFLRFTGLTISGSDRREFTLAQFEKLGEQYWEAFASRRP